MTRISSGRCYRIAVIVPLALLVLAAVAVGIVAFGVHPVWAQFPHGIEVIVMSRRLQWPLVALAVILCLTLIVLIISGKRRAWWLIGLGPILAILIHHFVLDPDRAFFVNEQPKFIAADLASFVGDEDWVVGVSDGGEATAYPYAALYPAPLVVEMGQETPTILMWSAFANRAVVVKIDRTIKANELEIVSMPANALLVYNGRVGQFINGVTGQTIDRQKPIGFGEPIGTIKTTWRHWRQMHPETRVLLPPMGVGGGVPTRPVLPFYPMPREISATTERTVALICTTRPSAVVEDEIDNAPTNIGKGQDAMVLFRDPGSGMARGFERNVSGDLWPTFSAKKFPHIPEAFMTDSDSGSAWTAQGVAVQGALKGQRLKPVEVDDQVYYNVARFWYGDLPIVSARNDGAAR